MNDDSIADYFKGSNCLPVDQPIGFAIRDRAGKPIRIE